jgi:phosphomevalonate kinase
VTVAEARAPGKLFVTGEYAVLVGAPAVVAAVDRYAHVRLELTAGDGPLVVESLAEGRTVTVERPLDGPVPGGDAGAVVAALRALAHRTGASGRAVVDSRAFLVGERKLGLGRSAATLAATTVALLGSARCETVLDAALAANACFQDGLGSGADVAASVYGGVVEVMRDDDGLRVASRQLPPGVQLVAGWTGDSAHTTPLLARFAAAARSGSVRALDDLRATAAQAADAIARGDAGALACAVDRSATLLERLGDETGIPILTPALARLVAAARRAGAVAKPSGAGAGDCGIALATSPAQAAAVRAAWQEEGLLPLQIAIAPEGATHG